MGHCLSAVRDGSNSDDLLSECLLLLASPSTPGWLLPPQGPSGLPPPRLCCLPPLQSRTLTLPPSSSALELPPSVSPDQEPESDLYSDPSSLATPGTPVSSNSYSLMLFWVLPFLRLWGCSVL